MGLYAMSFVLLAWTLCYLPLQTLLPIVVDGVSL